MTYDFGVTREHDHIRVLVTGQRSPDMDTALKDMMTVWSEVAGVCRETGVTRVLAVLQLTGEVPVMGSYGIVTQADEFGWSRHFRLALVDLNEESLKGNRFTETVAVNRGYPLKVFADEQEARAWLLGG